MAKKEKEPQYIMSALNTPMLNYRVYVMGKVEKILNLLIIFIVSGAIGIVFYGGLFKDEKGINTKLTYISDLIVFTIVGVIGCTYFMPIRTKQLHDKRKNELNVQFKSFLEALTISLSSGMNMNDSIQSVYKTLKDQYTEKGYIVREVEEMLAGINNNIPLEEMIMSLGDRSEIEDIRNFAIVFKMSFRTGGNLKDIVRRTSDIISSKIGIASEIETALSSNKSQFSIMMIIPVILMIMLKSMSSQFAQSFTTIPGMIATTVAIGIFFLAYKLGEKIMDI